MKGFFSIGERRGLIALLIVLSMIVAGIFTFKHFSSTSTFDQSQKARFDSISIQLHKQIEAEKTLPATRKKATGKKQSKTKQKNSYKKSKKIYIDRDPLNESLPSR